MSVNFSSGAPTVFAQYALGYPGAPKMKSLVSGGETDTVASPTDSFAVNPTLQADQTDAISGSGDPQAAPPPQETSQSAAMSPNAVLRDEPAPVSDSGPLSSPLLVGYGKAETLAQVAENAAKLPAIARTMVMNDVAGVFGLTPHKMADRYQMDLSDDPKLKATLENSHAFAFRALDDLAAKVLKHTAGGDFQGLDSSRMSVDRYGDAISQHVGYVAGEIGRSADVKEQPGREVSRILLRNYFEGKLEDTAGTGESDPKALLASELSKAAGSDSVAAFVNDPKNEFLFSKQQMGTAGSLLPNVASYYAGEAVLQFAAKLMDGDDRRAESFVKHVFSRPVEELNQMVTDPQGLTGLMVNFAATAHHQAWQWAKLGGAGVAAKAGDESAALKAWNHGQIGSTLNVITEDSNAAMKVAEQVESYLLRDGKLVPCERGRATGKPSLQSLLQHVERHGIYADGGDGMRIISSQAVEVKERLWSEVEKASRLSDWKAGNELAGDVVAHTCASFASQAVKADFQERDTLVSLYRDAIGRFSPQLEKLLASGPPQKGDERYQAFFQELAGEFGFEALKNHMGTGAAHDLVRNASIAHIIPIACDALRLPYQKDFTPAQLVADMQELQKTILKDDYFLTQPGFLDDLRSEATRPPVNHVDRKALENGIRVPNAVWMWTQLTRGLVEKKPGRYTGGEADLSSDKFPSSVQFSPPDVRDVELFVWARHRLTTHGYEPKDATRMALATVVLTQHKDLLQLRKAS